MSWKKIIANVIGLLLGFGFGAIYFKGCSNPDFEDEDNITIPENVISEETKKIDSLKLEIIKREELIGHLKDSVKIIETIRTIKVDNIKKLPLDSAVMYLNLKLEKYENEY